MTSRRLQKVARVVQATVSEVIQNHLADPRIKGLVSVTRVELSADLRSAKTYLSVLGADDAQQRLTLQAIEHARGVIQGHLADRLEMKLCPSLRFYLDDSLKQGFAVMKIIDQVAAELSEKDKQAESDDDIAPPPDQE